MYPGSIPFLHYPPPPTSLPEADRAELLIFSPLAVNKKSFLCPPSLDGGGMRGVSRRGGGTAGEGENLCEKGMLPAPSKKRRFAGFAHLKCLWGAGTRARRRSTNRSPVWSEVGRMGKFNGAPISASAGLRIISACACLARRIKQHIRGRKKL